MNVFYLESGSLKVGRILKETGASLQVQSQFGKKVKVKGNHVFLSFDHASPDDFFNDVQKIAQTVDPDLLWEAFDGFEGGYSDVAKVFYGESVSLEQKASVLRVLFDNPTHFYKKGQGNFKPATLEALTSAKASLALKKQRDIILENYVNQLCEFKMPEGCVNNFPRVLYGPDKNELEEKAVDRACAQLNLGRRELFKKLSVLPKPEDFHYGQFLYDQFNNSSQHRNNERVEEAVGLSEARVSAFSIDDAATTEIDDAFSLSANDDNGGWHLGIHIAAPGLCVTPESPLDNELRSRMSTVYHPAGKLTMSPPLIVEQFSLSEEKRVPVVSLYADIDPAFEVLKVETKIEYLTVEDNLDLSSIDQYFDPELGVNQPSECPRGRELNVLFQFANKLREMRGESRTHIHRKEYSFSVNDDRVTIQPRRRGSPVDVIVSELMIFSNSKWASELKQAGIATLFRVKTKAKTGLSTLPLPHEKMGLDSYAWISSPLRRYVDLVNQRQLISYVLSEEPIFDATDEVLINIINSFETKYAKYSEFQRAMERFWCLKWLQQKDQLEYSAEVLRDSLVRLNDIPLVCKANQLPPNSVGQMVWIKILDINLYDNFVICEWINGSEPVIDDFAA